MRYAGEEYRNFDGKRTWELIVNDTIVVLISTGNTTKPEVNCIGFDVATLKAKWELGGATAGNFYDGIVSFKVDLQKGEFYAWTWSGYKLTVDPETGSVLSRKFVK